MTAYSEYFFGVISKPVPWGIWGTLRNVKWILKRGQKKSLKMFFYHVFKSPTAGALYFGIANLLMEIIPLLSLLFCL